MNVAYLSIVMSALNVVLWTVVLVLATRDWGQFHDERAARAVLTSMVLVAAAAGSMASAFGYLMMSLGNVDAAPPLAFVAAVARVVMLLGGVAYLAANRGGRR